MGASVFAYWPGMSPEDYREQPGFWNDCKAWGNWMAERLNHPKALKAIALLDVAELLTVFTDGMEESDVQWVSPDALGFAALRLRAAVENDHPATRPILASYEINANNVDPIKEEFARDLWDVSEHALFCRKRGVEKMTLEVNW